MAEELVGPHEVHPRPLDHALEPPRQRLGGHDPGGPVLVPVGGEAGEEGRCPTVVDVEALLGQLGGDAAHCGEDEVEPLAVVGLGGDGVGRLDSSTRASPGRALPSAPTPRSSWSPNTHTVSIAESYDGCYANDEAALADGGDGAVNAGGPRCP